MSYELAEIEPVVFPDDPEDQEVDVRGVAESASYNQRLISQLELVNADESRRLAYQIQLANEVQEAVDFARWAELPEDEDFQRWEGFIEQGRVAKDKLIVGHLRLVAHIARLTKGWVPFGYERVNARGDSVFRGARIQDLSVFSGSPMSLEDRIQAGTFGLMRAAELYKPDKGANFVTYSFHHIESAISRAIDYDRGVKIPIHVLERIRKIEKSEAKLALELGRQPTAHEIYLDTGVYEDEIENALDAKKRFWQVASIDELGQEDLEKRFYPVDNLRFSYDEEYQDQIMLEQQADQLLAMFYDNPVDQRFRDVLAMRYGLATGEPMTLEEIGIQIDVTRARVGQLERQAIGRLDDRAYEQSARHFAPRKAAMIRAAQEERAYRDRCKELFRVAMEKALAANSAAAGGNELQDLQVAGAGSATAHY